MVARATMAEIDPVRMSIDDAVELFRESVVPALHEQPGYEGVYVLLSPRGQGARADLLGRARRPPTPASPAVGASTRADREVRDALSARRPAARRTRSSLAEEPTSSSARRRHERALRHPDGRRWSSSSPSCSPIALGRLGASPCGTACCFKLGVRNVRRRRGRSALIVVGLMLGTTIIAAALATGDTMNHTIRSTATKALGETDEVVSARGAVEDIPGELGQATGTGYFDARVVERIESASAQVWRTASPGRSARTSPFRRRYQRQTEPTRLALRARSGAHGRLCADPRRRGRRGHARRAGARASST